MDLNQYSEWNPFIKSLKGKAQVGEVLEVLISPPAGKPMIFKPRVLSVRENSEFRWLGHFIVPGLLDGEHIFTVTERENGCHFMQKEIFTGLLVAFFWSSMETSTRTGFELMNDALKERAERENTT